MIALAITFAVLLFAGVPIAFALGLSGAAGLVSSHFMLVGVPSRMFTGIDSFVLLAAPFYILAGELMNRGGVTKRLIRFATIVTRGLRGGTAFANIFASVLFAGISGTAIADTAALGQIFIKGMPEEGYSKEYAAAITVASSVIGPIIPPSVIMVIYAAVAQMSVIDLFLAGIGPGLLLGVAVAAVVWWDARRGRLPLTEIAVARHELPKLGLDTALVVSLPTFIVLGTLSGAFTATEAGGIAVIYAALLGWFVFKSLNHREVWASLIISGRTTATLFLLVGAATVLSYVLALTGATNVLKGLASVFQGEPTLFMFAVMGLLLIAGCFLDPGAAIVLLVPLLIPISRAIGIPDLQFSIFTILTLTVGLITPPVGVCLFVACRIGDIDVWRLVRTLFPFLLAELVVVISMIFVPEIATWLPNVLR